MPTETRLVVGESATAVGDGSVRMVLDGMHPCMTPGAGPLVLTGAQDGRWFVKP